jgi:hypothetical protein
LHRSSAHCAAVLAGLLLGGCGTGDPGGPGDPDAGGLPSGDCAQVVGGPSSSVHVLRFESAGASTRVHLRRRYVQVGAGESVIYALEAMWIERAGECLPILEDSRLGYVNSHHNWRDRATGTADGIEYQVTMDKQFLPEVTWSIRLTGTRADTTAAFTPIDLITTGGPNSLQETPARLPVLITEVMPENTGGWRDDAGELAPWIELWNPSSEATNLGGWALSNDPAQRRRWLFPAGTEIGRHQVLMVAADGQPDQGPLHTSFALTPGAGRVVLTEPGGVTAGERNYPAVAANRSVQFSWTTDRFEPSATATPGDVATP